METPRTPTEEAWIEEGEGERIQSMGWKELWMKEDWWAIWLGLGIVVVAYLFYANGSSIKWIAITMVILWAIVMIFALPLISRALHLHTGVAGAWIGTSEFADAAAQAYGNLAGHVPGIAGAANDSVWGFTLMKVVGRDIWIGIWAFVLALIATTRWEVKPGAKPNPAEIWWRFPKFVIGFVIASIIMTLIAHGYTLDQYKHQVFPVLTGPIKAMRTWAFIFCFFSIGLTTRFRELAHAGAKPFWAFSSDVVVNVVLGFVLSTIVFAGYWQTLSH